MMFKKILIANRGEIACRVIETARRMGLATVAVYSSADRDARHVMLADEAISIGPAAPRESYLNADAILHACALTGAEALHPGYGFLSENAGFASRLEAAGVVFIGPRPDAIAAMGDKIASKRLARAAGVNTIPGHDEPIATRVEAREVASKVGYPVMFKATAGGGGRGLRVARDDAEAGEAFDACRAEARDAFGDDRVFLERFIGEPRHIEIQVFGDAFGNVIHLGERECSIQRRHQKLLEEAPSPFLDDATRTAMAAQAVLLAKAVSYQSAGTVEFVVGPRKDFYFLEMNTRLQVEHPVTEMVTGLDLVEWMIRVAAGERLPLSRDEVRREGWAMECRVNAEDPSRGFLPSTGRLVRFLPPPRIPNALRVDTGVEEGGEISVYYDAMIAKVIAHGRTRDEAISRLSDALNAFVVRGVATNLGFQSVLLRHPRFLSGDFNTSFLAEEFPDGLQAADHRHRRPELLASAAALARLLHIERASKISGQLPGHARKVSDDWVVRLQGRDLCFRLDRVSGGCDILLEGQAHGLRTDWKLGDSLMRGTWDGHPVCLQVERVGLNFRIGHEGSVVDAVVMTPRAAELLALMPERPPPDLSKYVISPMPGLLVEVAVEQGQVVRAGETLVVIEAMKMRNVLKADREALVEEVLARPGDSLTVDQPILKFGKLHVS